MKILYTAFNGITNSSKLLLDNITTEEKNKLYLKNSFKTSVEQLTNKVKSNEYDLIISFGQAPLDKGTIKIETRGNGIVSYDSDYDYEELERIFNKNKFKTIISNDAGNYFCNNIYYNGLKYIKENNLKTRMIFIHIPQIDNINDIQEISNIFNNKKGIR